MDRHMVVALLDSTALPGVFSNEVEEALAQWRADAATSPSGLLQVSLTIVADDLSEALSIAVQLLETSGRLLSITVELEDLPFGAVHPEETGACAAQSDAGAEQGKTVAPSW